MNGLNTDIVGKVRIDSIMLNVYSSLDEPLFLASEVANLIGYSDNNTWKLTQMCENDEKLKLPLVVAGQRRIVLFVTELGLYNILSQSRTVSARKWRRVVHDQLIELRKEKKLTIEEQFDEWNAEIDDIFYDEETDTFYKSVTVPGGDVEQVPLR